MKNTEFLYWLQGYFEIGMNDILDDEQIDIIQRHIELVKKCAEEHDRSVHPFIYKIEGYLSAIKELKSNEIPMVVLKLRTDLHSLFKHEIDKEEDKNGPDLKQTLQQIHDGSNPENYPPPSNFPYSPLVRC